jgi:PelA/Pel-15E family pectate lyase
VGCVAPNACRTSFRFLASCSRWIALTLCAVLLAVNATAAASWGTFAKKSDDWYRSPDGQRITTNILSWQSPHGSWPKNLDTASRPYAGDPKTLQGTFDNGATLGELRFLARAYLATQSPRCQQAFEKGLDQIREAQYPTGGWPQYYPPSKQYHRHITFNDGTMVALMRFLREVSSATEYSFVDAARHQAARTAFERGVQCILKCQIKVNGRLTVWCAQHDEIDYHPRPGRSYELVSLSGAESAGILEFLMSLDQPNADVQRAVQAGAEWFESAKLAGIRQVVVDRDKKIIRDLQAPPLWARFYEIESNRPIFSGRDGVKKYDVADIEPERRNGYSWYGNWGERVAAEYAKWKAKPR